MSKKMRMLQILNLWRLIPAYLIVCVSNNKAIIFEEIQHWKKCTRRTEKSGFDLFSSLMLELKEYYYVVSYDFFKSFKSKALNAYTMKNTESSIGYLSYYLGTLLSESGNGIAVITEDEFLLDINTLGSRHYPDNTCVIVMCKSKQDRCYRCADAFGMNIVVADIEQLVLQKRIFHRTVILLNGE